MSIDIYFICFMLLLLHVWRVDALPSRTANIGLPGVSVGPAV